mgnify:CR=1 FL=1
MIDEYQDTNRSQYELMRLLSQPHHECRAWWAMKTSPSIAGAAPISATSWISSATIPAPASSAWSRTTARRRTFWRRPARWWRTTKARKGKWLWTDAGAGELIGLYAGFDCRKRSAVHRRRYRDACWRQSGRPRGRAVPHQLAIAPDRRSAAALRAQVYRGGRIQLLPARRSQGHRWRI